MKPDPIIFSESRQHDYAKLIRKENGIEERREAIKRQLGLSLTGCYIITALSVLNLFFGTREGAIWMFIIFSMTWLTYLLKTLELKSIMHLEYALMKETEPDAVVNASAADGKPENHLHD